MLLGRLLRLMGGGWGGSYCHWDKGIDMYCLYNVRARPYTPTIQSNYPKYQQYNIIHRIEDHYTSVIIYVHVHLESESRGSVAPGPARGAGYLPLSTGPIHLLVVAAVEERLVPRRRQSAIGRLG